MTTTNLRVVSGSLEVRCPQCQTRHRSKEIALAPHDKPSYCDTCLTQVASPAEVITINALNNLDAELWDASLINTKSNGATRANLARLVTAATSHIIERRLK